MAIVHRLVLHQHGMNIKMEQGCCEGCKGKCTTQRSAFTFVADDSIPCACLNHILHGGPCGVQSYVMLFLFRDLLFFQLLDYS